MGVNRGVLVYGFYNKCDLSKVDTTISFEILRNSYVFLSRSDKRKLTKENPNRWIDEKAQEDIDKIF